MEWFLLEHQRTKLRFVVLDVDTVWLVVYYCVAPRNRNVIDADFTVVASSHLELGVVVSEVKQVDGAARIFF